MLCRACYCQVFTAAAVSQHTYTQIEVTVPHRHMWYLLLQESHGWYTLTCMLSLPIQEGSGRPLLFAFLLQERLPGRLSVGDLLTAHV